MLVLSGGRVFCEGSAQKGRGEGGEGRRRRIVLLCMLHTTYFSDKVPPAEPLLECFLLSFCSYLCLACRRAWSIPSVEREYQRRSSTSGVPARVPSPFELLLLFLL